MPAGPGRPVGSGTSSIKAILQEWVRDNRDKVMAAIERGMAAAPPKSAPYLTLAANYLDGKPIERVEVLAKHVLIGVGLDMAMADPLAQLARAPTPVLGEGDTGETPVPAEVELSQS